LNFKQWIKKELVSESGTSSACVAGFQRMLIPSVRRKWPGGWGEEDPFFKKKKKKKKSS
jgi:hypothetical protein